jgi:hypothetical protein
MARGKRMEVGLKEYSRRDTEIHGVGYPVNHRNNPSLRRLSIRKGGELLLNLTSAW